MAVQSSIEARDFRRWINVAALVLVLVVNYLANALPINGQTTAEVSDSLPILFVPAGYAFAIWGVIYLGLTAFVVYQALPAQRNNPSVERVGYLFALSCLANSLWIFLWHYELFPLTIVVMFALLALLIAIYVRLDPFRWGATPADRWLVHIPFSIYLGWITVATVANASGVLYALGWNGAGLSPETWTAIMLFAGLVIAAAVAIPRNDLAYLLVILWAYMAIIVKHQDNRGVAFPASIAAALVFLTLLVAIYWKRSEPLPETGG